MHERVIVGVGLGNVPKEVVVRRFTVKSVAMARGVVVRVAGDHSTGVHVGRQDEGLGHDPSHHRPDLDSKCHLPDWKR